MATIHLIGGGMVRIPGSRVHVAGNVKKATEGPGVEMLNGPLERWLPNGAWSPPEAASLNPLAIAYIVED